MNYFLIIDLLLVVFIFYASNYSYKKKTYTKIFDYFKIFLLVTISAKLALYTGTLLQKLYITKADTYTTLLLIGFGINILILYFSYKSIFQFFNRIINSKTVREFIAFFISFLEVFILTTFSIYLVMQLYISKKYLYKYMHKTYSYTYIERFYHNFLNDDFVNMLMGSDTGTNRKEILFKSFKNSL